MVAERLCWRLQEAVVFPDMRLPLPHITGSFGVACLAGGDERRRTDRARRCGAVPRQAGRAQPRRALTAPDTHGRHVDARAGSVQYAP